MKPDVFSHTCCFIGQSVLRPGDEQKIITRIRHRLYPLVNSRDTNVCYFGLCAIPGFSFLAADYLLELKKDMKRLKLILVLPYFGYEDTFSPEERAHALHIQKGADKIVYVCPAPEEKSISLCYRHLIDGSRYCCFYCNEPSGLAAAAARYALSKQRIVWNTSSFDIAAL